MKYFSLDKKPTVYNIGIASIVMFIVFLVLFYLNKPSLIIASFNVYFVAVLFMLAQAFIKQLKHNAYSYNTIIYSGFFLFVLFMLFTLISIILRIISL